ncbi:hypothetical protein [Rhizobium sp. OAE497]|uniref:hypothetical protein n=1 Tax=Rhizobium sp. OAE497 TaxID=2663796 RepID=UPI0018F461B2
MDYLASPYLKAQTAIASLKAAVYETLALANGNGLRNVDIGKALGIYMGHVDHEGHISRTILALMESEGTVQQDKTSKTWTLARHGD